MLPSAGENPACHPLHSDVISLGTKGLNVVSRKGIALHVTGTRGRDVRSVCLPALWALTFQKGNTLSCKVKGKLILNKMPKSPYCTDPGKTKPAIHQLLNDKRQSTQQMP